MTGAGGNRRRPYGRPARGSWRSTGRRGRELTDGAEAAAQAGVVILTVPDVVVTHDRRMRARFTGNHLELSAGRITQPVTRQETDPRLPVARDRL
ncbi:hypothetical protein GCM10010207_39470 [Streptomyces atratus]|uniref:hypothetical protein n=1 Tax=Streptomyces atratus TaxID=1893 RepID=UPI0016705188|nr:hypothetical protein [Streptomyces atratus]GGT35448.1 hypothetical protein GCM10010207_39470 [Streptomyces atratus]